MTDKTFDKLSENSLFMEDPTPLNEYMTGAVEVCDTYLSVERSEHEYREGVSIGIRPYVL